MGILDSSTTTIDCVLTKKGRELLSKGESEFKITKFAVSDEGVDYRMYNTNHPSGSTSYGTEITSMPVLEAPVDETLSMKWKLVTFPKGTSKMPIVAVTPTVLSLNFNQKSVVTPSTTSYIAGFDNSTLGYTCILSNSDLATLEVQEVAADQTSIGTSPSWMDDASLQKSTIRVGKTFRVIAKDVTALQVANRVGTITVIANETGGQAELNVTIVPPTGSIYTTPGV